MAKLKKPGKSGGGKASKSIPVEDVHGNKHVLKATVVTVDDSKVKKTESAKITDDSGSQPFISNKIVQPPLSQDELSVLQEVSSELGQVLDSLAVGIEGFGGRLIRRRRPENFAEQESQSEDEGSTKEDVKASEEKAWLDSLLTFPNPDEDFTEMRKATRTQLEATGNAYWELVPVSITNESNRGRYSCINRINPSTMFITKPDKKMTRMKLKYVDENLNLREKTFSKRFRRFVQIVGAKKVFFKEFGDPRVIDRKTGEVVAPSIHAWERNKKLQRKLPKKKWANEVYHFAIPTPRRTPYGMPRHTGNIIAIKGSRGADETNILTQQNNHVPSMAIMVSGGMLTEGSVQRIQEFVDGQIKSNSNYSKFLILEGEPQHDSLSGAGNMKVEIKTLSDNQHQDQLWQEYDKQNASKIRRSHRTPPLMVGVTEDLNRSTAQESERMSEKWVYSPARESMDKAINKILMQQGFVHWFFKSNSPNVTNDEDLVKLLTGGEKTGGLTPRISRMLLEDILNRELPPVKQTPDFDPDVPFSLSIARLSQGQGRANQSGSMSERGQNRRPRKPVGRPTNPDGNRFTNPDINPEVVDKLFEKLEGENMLESLVQNPEDGIEAFRFLRDHLEDSLDVDSFGETKRDYFDHES